MEQENLIGVFGQEMVCEYKGRRYYVRDNGAIYRQCKEDGVKRKWDEEWTFGKFDPNTGYMLIGQERVHRIVCTAYHGEPVGAFHFLKGFSLIKRHNSRYIAISSFSLEVASW